MTRPNSNIIPRWRVFVLVDGTCVIQRAAGEVVDLVSRQPRPYSHQHDFGHIVTDDELATLRGMGHVTRFNRYQVWLAEPLPWSEGAHQHPEPQTRSAEAPSTSAHRSTDTFPTLDELIASQNQPLSGTIVLAVSRDEERQAFADLFRDMSLDVSHAADAATALRLLEDHHADALLIDLSLPDMHGWELISKVKEITILRDLPILIVVDEPDLMFTVAKVDYVKRPVSISRLRYQLWRIFNERLNPDES